LQPTSPINHIVEHLFRHESGKLVAVLTKIFGPHNLQLAEDVAQDCLLKAMDSWKINGLPENPSAWLFTVARNKALDVLRKEQRHKAFAASLPPELKSEYSLSFTINDNINPDRADDDMLRMMFVCCHPVLNMESQVALILKTLCGFSVSEIAKAFITSIDTIEKRLYRARQKFKEEKIAFEIPSIKDKEERLENVLTAIYLLFNEGYNSAQHEDLIRNDLINESFRLCELLLGNPQTKSSKVLSLLALMSFTHSRSEERLDKDGNIILLSKQDRAKWNTELISRAVHYLNEAGSYNEINTYLLEATIAYEHSMAKTYAQTNWEHIINFYNLLYQLNPSSVIALNRAIAIAELHGAEAGIQSIKAIEQIDGLQKYYLYHATLGELYARMNEKEKAFEFLSNAIKLTSSPTEKKLLSAKQEALK
jgi:RNA polymerase sigma-70 factor (ECF subfamily)